MMCLPARALRCAARAALLSLAAAPVVAGPDVITSTIADMTKYGTVGTITAYAMTTVSCNIGDADAIWIDCSSGPQCNQHPVIAQNLYRYKVVGGAGRFEQIGMSWLKHGWCAADAGSCRPGPTRTNGSCDWLGLNKTDTYGASLNAEQPDLGPRSEVNPYLGQFAYPYVRNWNQSGNAIFKRLQVENADINPSLNFGAGYVGEAQYVCTDEAPFDTQYNNCSWRRLAVGTFSSGGWNLTFTTATVQEQPAIMSWPTFESGVTLVETTVPTSDGRIVLGYKVTPLESGLWNYEYALYNMNSQRGVRGLWVPMLGHVAATQLGFHDVFYHSGEPFSDVDWDVSKTDTTLGWETQTFAENANANALRWGTMYNFRFVSPAPPVAGQVTVGLFRSGGPDTMTIEAQVPRPIGDGNCDGVVNFDDIDGFVAALIGEAAYAELYPGCAWINSDMNLDHAVNFDDIDGFVAALSSP